MSQIDFDKMQGLVPAIVQDADNGEVLMVGFMNREALERRSHRLRDVFQPHAQQAVDEGRNQRQPSAAGLRRDRLRPGHGAGARCAWKVTASSATKARGPASPAGRIGDGGDAMKIRLGIPKGSLQDATIALFAAAGFKIYANGRSYFPTTDDPEIECMLIRAQEMARYVEHGALDAGLTGLDWVVESGLEVVTVADLIYAKQSRGQGAMGARRPGESTVQRAEDLAGKIIATELVQVTKSYFASEECSCEG